MLRSFVLVTVFAVIVAKPFNNEAVRHHQPLYISLQNILHELGDYFKRIDKTPQIDQLGHNFKRNSLNQDIISKPTEAIADTLLHLVNDYFKGRALRSENDPVPTADGSLLHQIGDFFKGRRSQNIDRMNRGETDPVPTADGSLLHQIGDFFKGRRSLNKDLSSRGETDPVPTSDGTLLHQVGDFFKGKKSLHQVMDQQLSPELFNSILHELGDYFKGRRTA
ncbi:uncharacterized protein LOC117341943 isoform X1 [Pecten maximus]|uniref:uncharacterized protein LOC117341943 isoform X1 n=1 Tax=Pecten maximus TaxID=6579 RepID=UPI0014583696|nr:uncharacterized protein LOC117341943 isoform X1 [Pecten maximus]